MFYVTDFNTPPKGIFSRLKLRILGEDPWVEYKKVEGIVYGVIKGVPRGNRKYFYKVKNVVGNDPVIFQNGFDIFMKNKRNKPIFNSPPFTSPDTTEYLQRLLVNFAIEVGETASKINRVKVLLIDIAGSCPGVCTELLKVAHQVVVMTNNPKRYDTCIRYTNQVLGTTPKVIGKTDKTSDISFIVAPYGLCGYIPQNVKTPVFSIKYSDDGYCVFEDGIIIEKFIKNACPQNISSFLFASQMFIERDYFTEDSAVFLYKGSKCFTTKEMAGLIK